VILAKDGKLAFAGPPWEALEYFGLERLGDVYDRMSEHAPEFWRDRFAAGKEYTRYVADRLPLDQPPPPANPSTPPVDLAKVRRSFLHQFPVLTAPCQNIADEASSPCLSPINVAFSRRASTPAKETHRHLISPSGIRRQ